MGVLQAADTQEKLSRQMFRRSREQ